MGREGRSPPWQGVLLLVVYLATFSMCLIGASGVLLVMGALILADLLAGALAGDLRQRLRRSRW
jgi:hypothetical protein